MHTEETGSLRLHQTAHVFCLRQIPLNAGSRMGSLHDCTGSMCLFIRLITTTPPSLGSTAKCIALGFPPRTHGHSIGVHLAFTFKALPDPFTVVERDEAQLKPNSQFSLFPPIIR